MTFDDIEAESPYLNRRRRSLAEVLAARAAKPPAVNVVMLPSNNDQKPETASRDAPWRTAQSA